MRVCVGRGREVKIETLFVNRAVALPHGSLHGAFKRVHPIVSKLVVGRGGGGVDRNAISSREVAGSRFDR